MLDINWADVQALVASVGPQLITIGVVLLLAIGVSGVVLLGFANDLFVNDRYTFWVMIALIVVALIVDEVWSRRVKASQGDQAATQ